MTITTGVILNEKKKELTVLFLDSNFDNEIHADRWNIDKGILTSYRRSVLSNSGGGRRRHGVVLQQMRVVL